MDDKPINASKSEMLKWQKIYNAAKWRFDKLSSEDAESYRDAENARVKKTMEIQCQHIIEASMEESTYYQHIPDTPRSVAHEKSRQRYINKLYSCIHSLTEKYISLKISILNLSCFLAVPPKAADMELRQQWQQLLRAKLKGKY